MKINIIQQPFILSAIDVIKYGTSSNYLTKLQYTTPLKWSIIAVERITACHKPIGYYEVKS
jgi:hypothetical protein